MAQSTLTFSFYYSLQRHLHLQVFLGQNGLGLPSVHPLFLQSLLLPGKLPACPQSREWFPNGPPPPASDWAIPPQAGGWGLMGSPGTKGPTRVDLVSPPGSAGPWRAASSSALREAPARRCPTWTAFLAHPAVGFQGFPERPARIRSGGVSQAASRLGEKQPWFPEPGAPLGGSALGSCSR